MKVKAGKLMTLTAWVILVSGFISVHAKEPFDKEAHDMELERIRAKIERNGYDWEAGETSVSILSEEEKAALCGLKAPEGYVEPVGDGKEKTDVTWPSVFDWREMGGVSSVKNQGSCGSCWAFCIEAALESYVMIYDGWTPDLSEQQLVSCNTYGYGCGGGWLSAADLFVNPGAVEESCMPYEASDSPPCIQDECDIAAFLDGWESIGSDTDAIKAALQFGPVPCAMTVYNDFYYYTDGCYQNSGTQSVNHGVTIVGWDDDVCGTGAWIIKNSWGPGWGDNGFAYIKYGSCNIGYGSIQYYYTPSNPVNLAYESHEADDSEGDGDGYPDPGETVYLSLSLVNNGSETATGVTGVISSEMSGLQITDPEADFPDIPPDETRDSVDPHFSIVIPADMEEGAYLPLTIVISSDFGQHESEFGLYVGETAIIFQDGFEDGDNGWTHFQIETQDDWQRGTPVGTSSYDPLSAFNGDCIWGNDLGFQGWDGNYKANAFNVLISPIIDCTGFHNVRLNYRRWLTVEKSMYDMARIFVNDQLVWQNDHDTDHIDTDWTLHDISISSIADDNPEVEFKFDLVADAGIHFGGWNIDEFSLIGAPFAGQPTPTPFYETPTPVPTPTAPDPTYTHTETPVTETPSPTFTHTPVPTSEPTHEEPTATPTDAPPFHTYTPTFTPSPTPTASPLPAYLVLNLNLNKSVFHPGDHFRLSLGIDNGPSSHHVDIYVALEVCGIYFWHPAWTTDINNLNIFLNAEQEMTISLLEFDLPASFDSGGPYQFMSIAAKPDTYETLSNFTVERFFLAN